MTVYRMSAVFYYFFLTFVMNKFVTQTKNLNCQRKYTAYIISLNWSL